MDVHQPGGQVQSLKRGSYHMEKSSWNNDTISNFLNFDISESECKIREDYIIAARGKVDRLIFML